MIDVGAYHRKSELEIKILNENLQASDEKYGDSPNGNIFEIERREHLKSYFIGTHPNVHFPIPPIH